MFGPPSWLVDPESSELSTLLSGVGGGGGGGVVLAKFEHLPVSPGRCLKMVPCNVNRLCI